MADVQQNTNSIVSWVGLIVAVIALFIAVAAFNRSGQDLEQVIATEVAQSTQELRYELAVMQAQARLLALRARVAAQDDLAAIAVEVDDIQADLNQAAEVAAVETRQEFRELNTELETLGRQLREGSADALGTLENAIEMTRREVDPGENEGVDAE